LAVADCGEARRQQRPEFDGGDLAVFLPDRLEQLGQGLATLGSVVQKPAKSSRICRVRAGNGIASYGKLLFLVYGK